MKGPVVAVAVAFLTAFAAAASQAQTLLDDIARIEARGELTVGMINQEVPPLVFTGADGEPAGFDVTIAQLVAQALGVTLTIVRSAETFDDVVDQVASGEVDIAVSYLTRTVSRARRVMFTEPYLSQDIALLVNRVFAARQETACPTSQQFVSELDDISIGVVPKGASASRLSSIDPEANLSTFDDIDGLMVAVRTGEIDMAFVGWIVAHQYLREHPEMRVFVTLCELETWTDRIAIAVNGELDELVPFLNVLLDSVTVVIDDDEVSLRVDPWY